MIATQIIKDQRGRRAKIKALEDAWCTATMAGKKFLALKQPH